MEEEPSSVSFRLIRGRLERYMVSVTGQKWPSTQCVCRERTPSCQLTISPGYMEKLDMVSNVIKISKLPTKYVLQPSNQVK